MKIRLVKTEYIVQEVFSETYVDINELDRISKMTLEDQEDELVYLFENSKEYIWTAEPVIGAKTTKTEFQLAENFSFLGQVITIDPPCIEAYYEEPKILTNIDSSWNKNEITDWSKLDHTTLKGFIRDRKIDSLLNNKQ